MHHPYLLIMAFEFFVIWFLMYKADRDENMNVGWIVSLVIVGLIFLLADAVIIIYNLLK